MYNFFSEVQRGIALRGDACEIMCGSTSASRIVSCHYLHHFRCVLHASVMAVVADVFDGQSLHQCETVSSPYNTVSVQNVAIFLHVHLFLNHTFILRR